jgi:hypothetical protein
MTYFFKNAFTLFALLLISSTGICETVHLEVQPILSKKTPISASADGSIVIMNPVSDVAGQTLPIGAEYFDNGLSSAVGICASIGKTYFNHKATDDGHIFDFGMKDHLEVFLNQNGQIREIKNLHFRVQLVICH